MFFRSSVWTWTIRSWPAADSPVEEEAPTLTRIWMQSHKICCRSSSSTIHYWILFFWFGCCGFGNQESGCLNLISPNSSCQTNPLLSTNPLLDSEHTAQPSKKLTKKECRYFQKLKRDSDSIHTINPKVHYWTPNSKETKICNNLSYNKVHHNCWVLQKFRLGEKQNTRVCKEEEEDEERDWIC